MIAFTPLPAFLDLHNGGSWRSAVVGAFSGAYSHVLIDSIMHSDIKPLAPFSDTNIMYQIMGLLPLHLFCIVLGVIGVVWLLHLVQIDGFKA